MDDANKLDASAFDQHAAAIEALSEAGEELAEQCGRWLTIARALCVGAGADTTGLARLQGLIARPRGFTGDHYEQTP